MVRALYISSSSSIVTTIPPGGLLEAHLALDFSWVHHEAHHGLRILHLHTEACRCYCAIEHGSLHWQCIVATMSCLCLVYEMHRLVLFVLTHYSCLIIKLEATMAAVPELPNSVCIVDPTLQYL